MLRARRQISWDYSHTPRAWHLLYHSLPWRLRVGISKASKVQVMLQISWFTGLKIHVKLKRRLLKIQPRRASTPLSQSLLASQQLSSFQLPLRTQLLSPPVTCVRSYLCEVPADVSPSLLTNYQV